MLTFPSIGTNYITYVSIRKVFQKADWMLQNKKNYNQRLVNRGILQKFTINGINVIALNKKNAVRKATNKIKASKL